MRTRAAPIISRRALTQFMLGVTRSSATLAVQALEGWWHRHRLRSKAVGQAGVDRERLRQGRGPRVVDRQVAGHGTSFGERAEVGIAVVRQVPERQLRRDQRAGAEGRGTDRRQAHTDAVGFRGRRPIVRFRTST
jgi:hypothetical protein